MRTNMVLVFLLVLVGGSLFADRGVTDRRGDWVDRMIAANGLVPSDPSDTIAPSRLSEADWIDRMTFLHGGSRPEMAWRGALVAEPLDWVDRVVASHGVNFAPSRMAATRITSR